MNRNFWILSVLVLAIFMTSAFAANVRSPRLVDQAKLTGTEPLPDMTVIPWNRDLVLDSPGIVVGTTEYDYQTNGSTGNRAFFDTDGGVHFVWMRGSGGSYPPPQRAVYFNYVDNAGNWLVPEIGQNISQANGDGYTQISGTTDNRAAAAYHSSATDFVIYAADNFPGMGIFSYFDPPDFIDLQCYWPYLTVDRNENIHIVMQENANEAGAPQAIGYTRSEDGGATWASLVNVDTLETLSHIVTASPVSDKVSIVYTHPRDYNSQYYNDVYYIESEDGINWPWREKTNITEYGSGEETFWAYTDCAAIYDYNDNLNIIWNVLEVSGDTLYYPVHMMHYSTGSGAMTSVVQSEPEWPSGGCDTGAWNLQIAKMSLGVNEATGAIYAVYTGFHPEDCSGNGYANGDLYMTYSVDGGTSWADSVNMTDSQTPGCPAGDCDSDHWSSLADNVGSDLHIFYVNDKDAGGIPQTEGQLTESPLLYMTWPNPITSIDDDSSVPTTFALAQNYPNPFNAKTNINFELEKASNVEITVYDITGARVTTLADGEFEAGVHSINWDANDVASGVYYYSLRANGEETTRKMTLLK